MKTLWRFGLVVAVASAGGVFLQGCSSIREVSALEFLELAKETQEVNSVKSTKLLCASGERVYLEQWRMRFLLGSAVTIYWTRLDGLPEDLVSELRAGEDPWERPERSRDATQAEDPDL